MTRTPEKVAASTARTGKNGVCQTAQVHKGKTETGKGKDTVQVASMFPGGKSKGAAPAGKDKACKPSTENGAKKGAQKPVKKKGQDQSSSGAKAGHKTAQSRGSPARVAGTSQKSDPHKKCKPVQTAYKPKGSDS